MTKKKEPMVLPAEPVKMGRPTLYRPEYCELLIEHSKQGGTFESFASVTHPPVAVSTLYLWTEDQPDFMYARERAEGYLHKFYEDMGKMLATGQLRRVKSEEPILVDGEPVPDPRRPGEYLMRREYEPVTGSANAWIFLCKNILGWSDKKMVALGRMGKPQSEERVDQLTPEERMREIQEMTKALKELEIAGIVKTG